MILRRKWREIEGEEWIFLVQLISGIFLAFVPFFLFWVLETAECGTMNRLEFYAGERFVSVNFESFVFESQVFAARKPHVRHS